MKRTRILTAIHYRRSFKKPVTRELPTHCPVCGTPLVASEAGQTQKECCKTQHESPSTSQEAT